jgi:hypothetical protein
MLFICFSNNKSATGGSQSNNFLLAWNRYKKEKEKKPDEMPFVIEFCTPDAVLELPIHSLGNSINLRPPLVWRRTAQNIQEEPPSSGHTTSPR